MKKIVAAVAVAGFMFTSAACAPAKFKNCTEMNKTYAGGIARPGARQVGMVQKYDPYVNQAAYDANKSMDRDNDGVACER